MSANNSAQSNKKKQGIAIELPTWVQWLIPPSILSLLTILTYVSSLNYPFQFDDIANISRKFAIRFDNPFTRWWGSSRWVGEWLNTINYKLGGFEPFYYRLFNMIVHALTGLVIFYLILSLCALIKRQEFFYNNRLYLAFCTAGLFLLHPVQTQTVTYVIQARLEGLAAFFVLLTTLLFVRAGMATSISAKSWLYSLFVVSAFLCYGTKEVVVVLPFLLMLVDWFFLCDQQWKKFKYHLVAHAAIVLVLGVLTIMHLGPRLMRDVVSISASSGNNRGNIITERPFDVITPYRFFISEFKVVLHYLMIFFWPFDISVEYDWKLASGFMTAGVIFPLMLLIMLFAFVGRCIFMKKNLPVAFGLSWFLIAIAPRSTIIPSPELVCDYKTYLASFGMMFILATILVHLILMIKDAMKPLPDMLKPEYAQILMISFFMIPLAFSSRQRNGIWETSVNFWEDNAKKAPGKARVHNNLGVAYSEKGEFDKAIKCYEEAIKLDKIYSDPLSNIAVAYSMKGDVDKAIEALKSAIHICPNYPEAYNNLGTLLLQKKDYERAEQVLLNAVQLRPHYGKAYYNLARMYEEKQDPDKAWTYLKKATEGDMDNAEIFFKLGQMSLKVKKYKEAAVAFQAVIESGVSDPQIWFNLANAEFLLEDYEKAVAIYKKLVEDNPLDARYSYNLAETYFTMKQYEKALEVFQQATNVPQTLPHAFFRTANCLEKLERQDEALAYMKQLLEVSAPEEFKKSVQNEVTRLTLQGKVEEGNGMMKLNDLKQAFAPYNDKDAVATGTSSRVIHVKVPKRA